LQCTLKKFKGFSSKLLKRSCLYLFNLQGKVVAVKKAQAKQGKIYVGKLMPELSDEDIKTHFTQVTSTMSICKFSLSNLGFEANHAHSLSNILKYDK
jgi:hypothetical protein